MGTQLPAMLRLLLVMSNNPSKEKIVAAIKELQKKSEIVATLETASNRNGACKIFQKGKFDVLLSHQDFEDSWGDGEDLIRELKQQDDNITTILMTIGRPRSTAGINRQITTNNYVSVFLDQLQEIASDKAFATATT